MRQKVVNEFIEWYITNIEGRKSSYYSKYFFSDKEKFTNKLLEYGEAFENSYGFNPFDVELSSVNDNFIQKISDELTNISGKFEEYSKSNQNGGPRAILGKRNYLLFLNEGMIEKTPKKGADFSRRKELMTWLMIEENFTSGSASSYASYVSSASEYLSDFFSTIDTLISEEKYTDLDDLLNESIATINDLKEKPALKSKYKSGLSKFKEFLLTDKEFVYEDEPLETVSTTASKKSKKKQSKRK